MTFWGWVGIIMLLGVWFEEYMAWKEDLELKKLRITLLAEKNTFELSDKDTWDELTGNVSLLKQISRKCADLRRDKVD